MADYQNEKHSKWKRATTQARELSLDAFDEFCDRQRRRIAGELGTPKPKRLNQGGTWMLTNRVAGKSERLELERAPTRSGSGLKLFVD